MTLFYNLSDFNIELRTESIHLTMLIVFKTQCNCNMNRCNTNQHSGGEDSCTFSKNANDIETFVANVDEMFTNEYKHSFLLQIVDMGINVEDITQQIVGLFSNAS